MVMAMTEIARQLLAVVEDGGWFDLTVVTPDDLKSALGAADGPIAASLFVWFCRHPQVESAQSAALEVVRTVWDPGAMAEIVAWLTRGADVPARMRRELWQTFVDRAEDREAHYGVRSQALYGAMVLAQNERSLLRRFQGTLLDLDPGDNGYYLRHAAKIVGVVLAHEPDEELRALLANLATVEDARDEAAMELGLDALRIGLDASEHDAALAAFRVALGWFENASAASEQRSDAELYRCCLDMLVAFQSESDTDDFSERVQRLRRNAFEYAAYLSTSDRPADIRSWLGMSYRERIHWSLLGMRLSSLDLSLRKRAWLHAASVIEDELLSVYTASRSFFRRNRTGGLEAVIRPRISGALRRDRLYLDYLDQWIAENADSDWLPDAEAMRRELAGARMLSLTRLPSEADPGGSTVAAILEHGRVPPEKRESVIACIEANVLALTAEATSKITYEILESVLIAMKDNGYYAKYPEAKNFFDVLLLFTIRYVVSRHNLSASSIPSVSFLFDRDPGDLPLEKDLQRDFHNFLMGTPFADICQAEARDLGGGRVDILFSHKWIKTVAELKRTKHNYDRERLINEYGLQTLSYQTTSVTFCILMVLDLFDRGGGQPHLSEQISVHRKIPSSGKTEHSIVLFRIQGRRKTPSDV